MNLTLKTDSNPTGSCRDFNLFRRNGLNAKTNWKKKPNPIWLACIDRQLKSSVLAHNDRSGHAVGMMSSNIFVITDKICQTFSRTRLCRHGNYYACKV